MAAGTVTVRLDMTDQDTNVSWATPANTTNVLVSATLGEIRMSDAAGFTEPFTIPANHPTDMTSYLVVGETNYFRGRKGSWLSIVYRHT